MNKRSRRKMLVAMVIFGVAIASVLLLNAFATKRRAKSAFSVRQTVTKNGCTV